MAGRAPLTDVHVQCLANEAVLQFTQRTDKWERARHPLHADKPWKAGVGPGISFANEVMALLPEYTKGGIGLVPCAFGGSEVARWEPGGDLFTETVRRVKLCQAAMDGTQLAGLLWHQGENDCGGDEETAAAYHSRLDRALCALREAFEEPDLPLIVGEMLYSLDQSDDDYVQASNINAAIVSAPSRLSSCACVSAFGLSHIGDRLHFDASSQEELGRRYAASWCNIVASDEMQRPPRLASTFCFPSPADLNEMDDERTMAAVRD
eukprot:CAMPEP_0119318536 /NCGR_PEP_ID=MMETSP1333-20130426/46724_1 /TAXON_ID=418940 /ORGANISM="Scyphosphaera apsteinii, Strain RCC1455" /LENGTH=264 /DNA_ID=CAMNT_0007324737 /DNA_START=125 /DNA_END=919 /DNA_ORIENTATION=-